MAVSTSSVRETYAGDGSTTTFSFPYYFLNQSDLIVDLWDTVAGTITTQTLNTDYTISGTADSSGNYPNGANVIFTTAPASTVDIVIVNNPSQLQNYSLLPNATIDAVGLTKQFDKMALQIQRLQDQINRSVILPDGMAGTFSTKLPANTALLQNANAYAVVNSSANGIALSSQSPAVQKYTVPYTAIQYAGLTYDYPLFTLPAAALLSSLFIKTSAAFSGTSITDVTANLGVSTNYSQFIFQYDMYASVADTNFSQVMANYLGSWASTTQIYLQATSVGANLSALSAGSVDVYATYYYLVGT